MCVSKMCVRDCACIWLYMRAFVYIRRPRLMQGGARQGLQVSVCATGNCNNNNSNNNSNSNSNNNNNDHNDDDDDDNSNSNSNSNSNNNNNNNDDNDDNNNNTLGSRRYVSEDTLLWGVKVSAYVERR